jgi:hypothetical protein
MPNCARRVWYKNRADNERDYGALSQTTHQQFYAPTMPQKRGALSGSLAPSLSEIWAVTGLLAFYLAVDILLGEGSHAALNYGGPLFLIAILGYANWKMIRVEGKNVWTSLFWFRLSTAVFFGIGTVAVYIVNDFTRLHLQVFYQFSDAEVFKHNLIVTLSVILVLAMARWVILATRNWGRASGVKPPKIRANSDQGLLLAAIVFLGLGLSLKYLFAIPYQMGWTTTILPGSIMNLTKLTPIGVFFITLWGQRNARWLLPAIFGLIAIEMLFSLLVFAKSGILFLLIMVSLAFLWDRATLKKLLVVGAVVLGTYLAIKPVVSYARHEIGLRYGFNTQAGFGERLEILSSYSLDIAVDDDFKEYQGGISRFSYVNAATFVVNLYDTGQPSDWPELIPAVFIPRIFWPEKPIITAIGTEIYELGTGHKGSSSGTGLFAEAYWAWGWGGVVVFMSFYGLVVGGLTRFTSNIMRNEQWLYFPVVLMGLQYGMRTDGHYISDAVGALVILVAMYVLLRGVEVFIKSLRKKSY